MARTSSAAKTETEAVTLTYDLFDLPTAQHKAGLAGLVLQIGSMKDRKLPPASIPIIQTLTATSATVQFTEKTVQGLLDDLYDASIEEARVKSKWPGQPPKREEEVEETDPESKKSRKSKRYVYDVVQPKGHFLRQHLPDKDEVWYKLWREMLWEIPRAKPATRGPFNERAQGRPCSEAAAVWKELQAFAKAGLNNSFRTCEVASALLLGAQAVNAEAVPFRGRSDQTLLLHFWQLTVLIFVPQQINNDGEGKFVGYALAIPEVSHLEHFTEDYPLMLHELKPNARDRPAAAVVDIPAQAALEFLENLARLTSRLAGKKRFNDSVSSIEYVHLVKLGNNVKSMAGGRVAPKPSLLEQYLAIVGSDNPPYRNPLFRSALLLSLLGDMPWHTCMARMLAERPWPFFIRSEDTPRAMPWFASDAAAKFQEVQREYQDELEEFAVKQTQQPSSPGEKPQLTLESIIYRLIQTYVWRKTEDKCGIKYETFKDKKIKDEKTGKERMAVPAEYAETKQKVCSDTFLAFRSRRDQDFVDYFISTIGQVGQFLPADDYLTVAGTLIGAHSRYDWEDVKGLAMLALSANS